MQVLHDMRVMSKLMLAAGLMCAIVVAVGLVGLMEISDMREVSDEMYHHELLGLAAAQEIDIGVLKILDAAEHALAHPEKVDAARREVETHWQGIQASLVQLETSNGGQAAESEEQEIRSELPIFLSFAQSMLAKIVAGDLVSAQADEQQLVQHEQSLDKLTHALSAQRADRARAEDVQAAAIHAQSRRFMFLFIVAALALGFAAAYIVARSISVPLRTSVQVLQDVAAGDLTASLELARRDELGLMAGALNEALGSMRGAMTEVRTAAFNVAGTASQLQAAAQDISSGSQEQASGLEEAAASLEEMAEAIRQNAEGAQRASEVSLESRTTAEHGGQVVAKAVEVMDGANVASQRIAQIIGTIDEIAFQTNLLALNAAVEAARAGEQGRGFAVVASEVRNLAQRSAGAAKEIKELIRDSVDKVKDGSRLVNESGESLGSIVESVKRVTDLVGEIAAASKEQSIGVDHVNTAVMQADRVTQGNAAQTEELSGSAESLAANSQQLLSLVSRFRVETAASSPVAAGEGRPAPVLSLHPRPRSSSSEPLAPTGTDGFEEF